MPSPTTNELQPLTTQDIEVLYDIVEAAQKIPGPPFRALFTAYDQVHKQQGFDSEHAQLYTGFLLRMRGVHAGDDGLFDRFEALLGQSGITLLEVNREGEGVEEVPTELRDGGVSGEDTGTQEHSTRLSRRASFSSVYDTLGEAQFKDGQINGLPRRISSAPKIARRASSTDPETRRNRPTQNGARPNLQTDLPVRGRVTAGSAGLPIHPHSRSASILSQRSLVIARRPSSDQPMPPAYSADESDFQTSPRSRRASGSTLSETSPDDAHFDPPEIPFQPSDTQLMDEANALSYQRTLALCRKILHKWRQQMVQSAQLYGEMEAQAVGLNRVALLREALSQWQTEREHHRNERRAQKLYDLFILNKAFTHWAACAGEALLRTKVARRHMLRTKYFKAWKEVTAVNELKVRRFVLQKFLCQWRQRTGIVEEDKYQAQLFHDRGLAHRALMKLFRESQEQRAALSDAERLRRQYFYTWLDIARTLRTREAWAQNSFWKHNTQRKTLQSLLNKVQSLRNAQSNAENFRNRMLLQGTFEELNRKTTYLPPFLQLSRRINIRIARSSLQIWHLRAQQSHQARLLNQRLLTRNTFTTWNDRLRSLVLSRMIDDRVATQALYKWYIASRASLFKRVLEAKLKRNSFVAWLDKTRIKKLQLANAEETFHANRRARVLRTYLGRWYATFRVYQQEENHAVSIYEPRIVQKYLHLWILKHTHLQKLERWSSDARFYVLTQHALSKWRNATHHAYKLRRREAYAIVRRNMKMGIARQALLKWHAAVASHSVMGRQAQETQENKILAIATRLLAVWRNKTNQIREKQRKAEQNHHTKLLRSTLHMLEDRHHEVQDMEDKALAFEVELTAAKAITCLRTLNWRLFQFQRLEQNALALCERNWEKHVRAMVRFWADQVAVTQDTRLDNVPLSPASPSPGPTRMSAQVDIARDLGMDEEDEEVARGEEWTAFDESAFGEQGLGFHLSFMPESSGIVGVTTSTPLPGYLRTPGKRSTARARARDRFLAQSTAGGTGVGNTTIVGTTMAVAETPAEGGAVIEGRGAASAPPATSLADTQPSVPAITPFQNKLRAQGYSERREQGSSTRRTGAGRFGIGRRPNVTFSGFEDILEDEGSGLGTGNGERKINKGKRVGQ